MQQSEPSQAGSTSPPSRARRLPAWLVVAIWIVVVLAVLVSLPFVGIRVIESKHHAFLWSVHVGQTRGQIERGFGKPSRTFTPDGQQELAYWLGPEGQYSSRTWCHTHRTVEGRRPARFDHVGMWLHSVAWAEFVFFDERGRAICILSGRS